MQQQPLAFTLVKTVVSARDEGKVLSPALATAWDLLRTELSPAHRVIASEVSWAPKHQEDLRFVIEGVRKQFEKDPELEGEFLAFLAEVEPFGEGDDTDTAILPIVVGGSTASTLPPTATDANIVFEDLPTENTELSSSDELPELDPQTPENFIEEIASAHEVEKAPTEIHNSDPQVSLTDQLPTISKVEASPITKAFQGNRSSSPANHPPVYEVETERSPYLKYGIIALSALVVATVAFSVWSFAGSDETNEIPTPVVEESIIPVDTIVEQLPIKPPAEIKKEPTVKYSAPGLARLSEKVDQLRQNGDYPGALTQQLNLAARLVAEDSPPLETAQAYSELAILYASQENILQAIVEQRKSLGFARLAFAKTDPALGRSHLKLASFYSDNGELHMARAHLQQARKIFGMAQELVSPTDLDKSAEVEQQILNAS